MVKNTDINDFLTMKLSGNMSIGSTPKLLGTFIDTIYCYFTLEYVNLKAIIYYIDKINSENRISRIIISDKVNDEMTKYIMNHLTNIRISFTIINEFDQENQAALIIITEKEIHHEPLLYIPAVPLDYLKYFGKAICKKCYQKLLLIDPGITKHYKKLPFFVTNECPVCGK